MILTGENFLFIGSILLFISIVAGKTGYRYGVPSLLLFLFVGMLFGSDGLGVQFSDPAKAQFIGMIALSVILFSGGMDTKIREIKPVALQGVVLSTFGVVLMAFITGAFIYFIGKIPYFNLEMSFILALLLASTMSSTDSASVFSILRSRNLHLKENLRPLLELESGSNDPMAYMLTIACIQVIMLGSAKIDFMVWFLILQFMLGLILGYLFGRLAVWIINAIDLDYSSLYPIFLLSFVFLCFSVTQKMQGNAYLAIYIAGLVVGNSDVVYKKVMVTFFDGLAWLVQIIMFLALGLLVNPMELLPVAAAAIVIGLFMIIIARPLTVWLCLVWDKKLTFNAKLFSAWVGLRGAVPIIFATYPQVENIKGADVIFNVVFFVTILSLVIQGTTVPFAARILGLVDDCNEKREFPVDIPTDIAASAQVTVSEQLAAYKGGILADIELPEGTLPLMVKRNDEYIIPHKDFVLTLNDKLLIISDDGNKLESLPPELGIKQCMIYKD